MRLDATSGGARPLSRYEIASSSSVGEAARVISSTYCGHRIKFLDRASDLRFRLCEATLSRTTVGCLSFNTDIHYDLGETEKFYLIQLADTGVIHYVNGGEVCDVTPDTGMVTSPTRPIVIRYRERSRGFIVKIERQALEHRLVALTGEALSEPLIFEPRLDDTSPFTARYRRFLHYLVGELDAGDSLTDNPILVANLEDTLMTALLMYHRHNYSARFDAAPPGSPTERLVRRVEEFVREHAADRLSIDDLIAVSDVSGRALFRAFRRYRSYSPMAFVRSTRLERARQSLLAADPDATVTRIANDSGFDHLGRFSLDYAKRFEESPSDTLKRARTPKIWHDG